MEKQHPIRRDHAGRGVSQEWGAGGIVKVPERDVRMVMLRRRQSLQEVIRQAGCGVQEGGIFRPDVCLRETEDAPCLPS